MYTNHTRISKKNGEFKWLLDGHLAADTSAHPINCPESRVLRLSSTGALIVCVSSHKRVLLNDHTLYYGTYKEWLASILGYNMFNPVKTYRMVCRFDLMRYKLVVLAGVFISEGDGSCFPPRCDKNITKTMR